MRRTGSIPCTDRSSGEMRPTVSVVGPWHSARGAGGASCPAAPPCSAVGTAEPTAGEGMLLPSGPCSATGLRQRLPLLKSSLYDALIHHIWKCLFCFHFFLKKKSWKYICLSQKSTVLQRARIESAFALLFKAFAFFLSAWYRTLLLAQIRYTRTVSGTQVHFSPTDAYWQL